MLPEGSVKMRVVVDSLLPDAYRLVDVSSDPENAEVPFTKPIVKVNSLKTPIQKDGAKLYESVFSFRLNILAAAKPRPYGVLLTFKTPEGKTVTTGFELPVGAKDSTLVQVTPPKNVIVDAGGREEIAFQIRNNYPEYNIRIFGYRVQCPDGLVAEQSFDEKTVKDPVKIVKHGTTEELRIPLQGETMSALMNLQAQPKVNVTLYYDDGYRVLQHLVPALDLDFQLRFAAWQRFLCALIGGVIGVWLRGLLPKGYGSLPGRRRPGALSRYSTGIILAALGWALSLGLGIEVLAMGGRSLASYSTPFGSLMLGIGFGVLHPSKVAQFVEGLFSKSLESEPAEANP